VFFVEAQSLMGEFGITRQHGPANALASGSKACRNFHSPDVGSSDISSDI
jgi:hypothetical protein